MTDAELDARYREESNGTMKPTLYRCKLCGCLWVRHSDQGWSLADAQQKPCWGCAIAAEP